MSIDGPAAIPDSASGRSGITILHVDDDTGLVDLAATVLEQERETFTVLTETTADAALARLDDDIDCVVSDYEMPGRDGLDFLRAVREQYPDLPFILFTGKGSEEIASDAISAGVTDYLQKESGLGQYAVLANRIENAVQKHRAERIVERAYGAMDTAREGIALLDEAGYFQYVNQAYADITGYDRADLIGEHWKLLYPAGRADRVHDEILPAVPDEGRWTGETAYERADGERIRVSHALAYTEDGTLICLVTPVEEGAVPRDDETPATGNDTPPDDSVIAAALDTLDDLFYVLDTDGNIVYVNERGAAITGHTAAEIQSMNVAELFDAADRDRIPQGIRNALETGSDERELRLLTDEGTTRTYEFNTRTLTGESPPRRLVGIGRDVSERKARERAVSELHRTTRDLMRADSKAEIGDLTVDALAEILTLTHAGVHLHREGTLVPISWTDHVEDTIGTPPELGPGSLAWQAFQSGEVRRYDDLQRVDELHNERTPLRSEIIVPLGEHGVVLLASTEPDAFDDTDRRLAALLCENATAALEHVEREKILRQHEDELERENERLDEFASLVSHDLRNPLNVASGRLELARKEYDSPHLDEASQAITRMETLIDDVLTLARDGKRVDAVDSVVLSNVVEQAWSTVETDDAELHIDGDLTIRADGTRLVRVFENLFRNSVEHGSTGSRAEPGDSVEHGSTSSRPQADDSVEHGATNRPPDGGGTDCATDRSGIDITVGPIDRDDVRGFYVEDDGVGIPADRQDRVFEAGYSTDSDGTGFGLRIVQDIVEAHGWTITVVDTDGGARFEMTDVDIDEEAVDG